MTLLAFATTWWRSPEHAAEKAQELQSWLWRIKHWFDPESIYLTTSANPAYNPIAGEVSLCESATAQSKGYDPVRWCYYLCDLEAMLRLADSVPDWDLLVNLETDWIIRHLNVPEMLEAFIDSTELVLAPAWCGNLENSFMVWKHDGVRRWLNGRLRNNLIGSGPEPMPAEEEMAKIFAAHWFNPWLKIPTMRQEYGIPHEKMIPDEVARTWPLVGRPSPVIRAEEVL